MNLTHQDVQEILQLLDASPFDELLLETDRFKLTLRRSSVGGWTQETLTTAAVRVVTTSETTAETNTSPGAGAASTPAAPPANPTLIDIRTPIIGTFYRAPKPGAPSFVEVGTEVKPNTVVGIVETMKLMNSVYAGAHGQIVEICQGDGNFVEQDQVLMRLNPTPTLR